MEGVPRTCPVAWGVLVIFAIMEKGQTCMEIFPPGPVGTEMNTGISLYCPLPGREVEEKGLGKVEMELGTKVCAIVCTCQIRETGHHPTYHRCHQQSPDIAPSPSAHQPLPIETGV